MVEMPIGKCKRDLIKVREKNCKTMPAPDEVRSIFENSNDGYEEELLTILKIMKPVHQVGLLDLQNVSVKKVLLVEVGEEDLL